MGNETGRARTFARATKRGEGEIKRKMIENDLSTSIDTDKYPQHTARIQNMERNSNQVNGSCRAVDMYLFREAAHELLLFIYFRSSLGSCNGHTAHTSTHKAQAMHENIFQVSRMEFGMSPLCR